MLPQTLILLAASLLFFTNTFSQDFNPVADLYQRRADSLYDAGQYQISAQIIVRKLKHDVCSVTKNKRP